MSSNLPLRTIRIPALRPQQCLFQHRRIPQAPRAFSTSSPQAFAATCLRQRQQSSLGRPSKRIQIAGASGQMGYAPQVNEAEIQQQGGMQEDIGLLQDTVIRPQWRNLPSPLSYAFWKLVWKLLKTKGMGIYSRIAYNRCFGKEGWREYWKPIDRFNSSHLKIVAETHYTNIYTNFAKGDMSPITRYLMQPIHANFTSRIAARKNIQLDWKMHGKPKCAIMSHRASMLGEDAPNSGFRQIVMRITSTQSVDVKSTDVAKKDAAFYGSGKPEQVVEYLVLQRRIMNGKEDPDWKIWGFAEESTPDRIAEDEKYWDEMVKANAA